MNNLKTFRQSHNLSQKEVASKLDISQQAYAAYENAESISNNKLLEQLSKIYKVDKELLVSGFVQEVNEINGIEDFLENSLTSFHTTKNSIDILNKNGYKEVKIEEPWLLKNGGKYYTKINNSSFVAFKVGNNKDKTFNIVTSHTDSPCLKIKGNSLIDTPEGKCINVEKYGGIILYSMLDIPLKIAGRICIKDGNCIKTRIIKSSFNVNIPSLCIHHNPTVNDGMALSTQTDMLPLLGVSENLYKSLLPNGEIIDADLYVVPTISPYRSGINNEFLVSPRIDNLTSVYTSILGLLNSKDNGIQIVYASDNEEVGSHTKEGADSHYLSTVMQKIASSLSMSDEEYLYAKENGFILTVDNGHAVHQAHSEKSDKDNKVYLNKGIVIKHHINYSTDSIGSSIVKTICRNNNIEYQEYYNNSDIRSGATTGLTNTSNLVMNGCDIGLAQLAMHSAIETVGYFDIDKMTNLIKSFFNSEISIKENDIYIK